MPDEIEPEKRTRSLEVAVHFRYPEVDDLPSYSDTLFIPIGIYNDLTPDDIAAMEQERYDAWKTAVQTPAPEPVPLTQEQAREQALSALEAVDAARDALIIALDDVPEASPTETS